MYTACVSLGKSLKLSGPYFLQPFPDDLISRLSQWSFFARICSHGGMTETWTESQEAERKGKGIAGKGEGETDTRVLCVSVENQNEPWI